MQGYHPNAGTHGGGNLTFWQPLTQAEAALLADRAKLQTGDPDALLRLALFASGGPRDPGAVEQYRAQVAGFVGKVRPLLEAEADPWQRGFRLFREMVRQYYRGGDKELGGYEFAQSSFAVLLETGRYNCISSAILYTVLARYLGMDVRGVLLGEHAFVELHLENGKTIEIETTAPTGYDWVHDAKFYEQGAKGWSAARGLRPTTLADYQQRRVVAPYLLIAANMRNQHTSPDRMPAVDHDRLWEAGLFLDDGPSARTDRANLYLLWATQLQRPGDAGTRGKLLDTVLPFFSGMLADSTASLATRNAAWAFLSIRARTLAERGKTDEAYSMAEKTMREVPKDLPDYALVRSNFLAVYHLCGTTHWNAAAWERAGAAFLRGLQLSETPKERAQYVQNFSGAYHNWAVEFEREGNWLRAARVFEQCVQLCPEATVCREKLTKLQGEHRL